MIYKFRVIAPGMDHHFAMLLAEVDDFCRNERGSNLPFSWYAQALSTLFNAKDPRLLLGMCLADDGDPVGGHMVGVVETQGFNRTGYLYQVRLRLCVPSEQRAAIRVEAMQTAKLWAKVNGCATLTMATARNIAAMERLVGWQPKLTIMTMPVED